jgi:hypothetical protein
VSWWDLLEKCYKESTNSENNKKIVQKMKSEKPGNNKYNGGSIIYNILATRFYLFEGCYI